MVTTSPPTTTPVPSAPGTRPRGGPASLARRAVLVLHLALGLGWLGVTAAFLVLTVWLLDVRDPATLRAGYAFHDLAVVWLARPAAIGSTSTGLLLVLLAGRFPAWRRWLWWVPAKLALVVTTVVVTVNISPEALRVAVDRADAVGSPAYTEVQYALVGVAVFHVVMITAAAVLSVFRPGVRRARRGRA
ncbi:MAG TPA: hypothetical protein VKZ81_11885 [Pseudonocardia sp.]|jgi:hypothetical protein|uniref:hypothetical protein n=1 Tax=Pseudonocardia sp. TaxID=60912 RepID=UPI002B4B7A01|nr:hypothetical protein [Pseudonocardia sp.]HLU56153.1 hypothetical protein [Pseudonocardia sp.]